MYTEKLRATRELETRNSRYETKEIDSESSWSFVYAKFLILQTKPKLSETQKLESPDFEREILISRFMVIS